MNDAYANGDGMGSFTKRLVAARGKAKGKKKGKKNRLASALMRRPNGHRGPRRDDDGDHEFR